MRSPIDHVDRYLPRSLIISLRPNWMPVSEKRIEPRYTIERLAGGCVVLLALQNGTGEPASRTLIRHAPP